MMLQKPLALLVLMTASLCRAHIGGSPLALQDIEPQMYCGRALSRALAVICYGAPFDKRAMNGFGYNSIMFPSYKEEARDSIWPRLPPHHARGLAVPSREKRYVVTECCDKPCSITELMSYC